MSTILTAPAKSGEKRRLQQVLGAVIAFAFLTASSHIAVPVGPVPMTMQTLAVTLTGVFLGPRLGAAVTAAWVACGFSGLPLFALGTAWLAAVLAMPVAKAVAVGAAPFVVGGLLKSVLGALIVKAARR